MREPHYWLLPALVFIGGWGLNLSDPDALAGAGFAVGAAAMWAGYIVRGQRIASKRSGVASLTVGCWVGALLLAPFFIGVSIPAAVVPAIVGVGILSTALPYSLEALALARLSPAIFGVLSALLPATSTVVGAVALQQIPSPAQLAGLVCISVAVYEGGYREHQGSRGGD